MYLQYLFFWVLNDLMVGYILCSFTCNCIISILYFILNKTEKYDVCRSYQGWGNFFFSWAARFNFSRPVKASLPAPGSGHFAILRKQNVADL